MSLITSCSSTYHGQFDDARPNNGKPVTGEDPGAGSCESSMSQLTRAKQYLDVLLNFGIVTIMTPAAWKDKVPHPLVLEPVVCGTL